VRVHTGNGGGLGGELDSRLYNQSAGMYSGFGADDEYNAYRYAKCIVFEYCSSYFITLTKTAYFLDLTHLHILRFTLPTR
jgi:SNW domain-containing protein 1